MYQQDGALWPGGLAPGGIVQRNAVDLKIMVDHRGALAHGLFLRAGGDGCWKGWGESRAQVKQAITKLYERSYQACAWQWARRRYLREMPD